MMLPLFVILSLITLGGAVAAMGQRNLVHCALALTVAFAGLAALYLQLDAQFLGFAQILVYIGAVAILIVFAILLTRGSEPTGQPIVSGTWWVGGCVAAAVFALLSGVILSSRALVREPVAPPQLIVRQIGDRLMTKFILPLEVLGLLLTAALIGAVIIAMREGSRREIGKQNQELEAAEEGSSVPEDARHKIIADTEPAVALGDSQAFIARDS